MFYNVYIHKIITFYTSNIYICQLFFNEIRKQNKKNQIGMLIFFIKNVFLLLKKIILPMCSGTQSWEIKVIKVGKHTYNSCKNGKQTLSKAVVLNLDCGALKTMIPHIQRICIHRTGVQSATLWRDIASTWATQDPQQAWLRKQNLTTPKVTIHQEQAEITKNRVNSPRTLKITELFVIDDIILK